VLANPETHHDLLELLHACLSLGFEGQYRAGAQRANLERVRQDVYETLRYFKERPGAELSPHWRGLSEASADRSWRLPLWAIAARHSCCRRRFFAMRVSITEEGEAAAAELLALNPATPVTIERANYEPVKEEAPKPVTTQIERIRAALAQDTCRQPDRSAEGRLHPHRNQQRAIVRVRQRRHQGGIRAHRGTDRRRSRCGTRADQNRRPHRQCQAEEIRPVQVEL
jgi:hypothetical protein